MRLFLMGRTFWKKRHLSAVSFFSAGSALSYTLLFPLPVFFVDLLSMWVNRILSKRLRLAFLALS